MRVSTQHKEHYNWLKNFGKAMEILSEHRSRQLPANRRE